MSAKVIASFREELKSHPAKLHGSQGQPAIGSQDALGRQERQNST